MNEKNLLNYPSRFAILIGLVGLFMILSAVVIMCIAGLMLHVPMAQVVDQINRPENANIARLLNTIASLLAFFLPALVLAILVNRRHPFQQLGFNCRISSKQVMLVVLITFASIILGGALGELNEKIPLPAKWFAAAKTMEDRYREAMMVMIQMRTKSEYLVSLLVIAAAPALFEEVLFRGGFQQVLIGWTKSKWAGIILTSVLFSAIHFSYFGFLPRAELGIVLGLIFYYSKNIWLNIFLHFLNNALVVTSLYNAARHGRSMSKTMDENMPMWWGIFALVLLVVLLRYLKKESSRIVPPENPVIDSFENNIS